MYKKYLFFILAALQFICLFNVPTANAQSLLKQTDINNSAKTDTLANKNQSNSAYTLYKQEINRRFAGGKWEKDLTKLSERALMQEYVRMVGIGNYLTAMSLDKKEKIEALLAAYTTINLQLKQQK